jgi:hypothetical protein
MLDEYHVTPSCNSSERAGPFMCCRMMKHDARMQLSTMLCNRNLDLVLAAVSVTSHCMQA